MEYIYALVDYGEYDEYNFEFIKVHKEDKDKFVQYCKESEQINGDNGISLNILAWIDKMDIVDKSLNDFNMSDIYKHQQKIKNTIDRIDKMESNESKWNKHYLRHKRNDLLKILEYKFK